MKKILVVVICIVAFMFTACEPFGPVIPDNAFSVSEGRYVTFSPGNLQYNQAFNDWQFAANQTDYIGKANNNMSSTYDGWIDLFSWSTVADGSIEDWGNITYIKWRILTNYEWEYLLNGRPNASLLRGVAQVNGVNGIILLPDCWTCPAGVTFKPGFTSIDKATFYAQHQTFTADQWAELEATGAVFLPAAGYLRDSRVHNVQHYGNYWSDSESDGDYAYYFGFRPNQGNVESGKKTDSRSVRLVKDVF